MQISLFESVNDVIVPNDAVYVIPVLARIKEEYPNHYMKIYAYLFFMTCWDNRNIYINKILEEREDSIISDLELYDVSMEDVTIRQALEKCKELYETPTVRAVDAVKKQIDGINSFLADTSPIGGKNGNVADINMFMLKLPDYIDISEKLEGKLIAEQTKIRGNKKIAYDQLDNYKNIKE